MAREWIKSLYVMASHAIRHFYVSSMGANSPIELFLLTSHFFQTQFLFVLISSESRLTLVIESVNVFNNSSIINKGLPQTPQKEICFLNTK